MKGLVFCWGRTNLPLPKLFSQLDVEWVYIDRTILYHPDIVGTIFSEEVQREVGLGANDVVLALHCPQSHSEDQVVKYCQAAYALLRPGGYFYVDNLLYTLQQVYRKTHPSLAPASSALSIYSEEQEEFAEDDADFQYAENFRRRLIEGDAEITAFVLDSLTNIQAQTGYSEFAQVRGFPDMIRFTK